MANPNGDLKSPLLPRRDRREPEVVVDIDGDGAAAGGGGGAEAAENPFEFLGAPPPPAARPSAVNPFRNHTPAMGGVYEWCKIAVCLPLVAVRLALFGIAIGIGYVATRIALQGWEDKENPMPKWRCRLMWITRICARCILFSFGYHWIRRIGRPASRELAPVVVSNHISYVEPIFFFYELFPTIVASESHDALPFVGTIIRAMQVIYVDRFSPMSRKHAVNEIKRKAACASFPHLLLFPEGTTSNGRFLISFQLGAFIPGYPVQPVIVRYPYVHFDQSWGNISLAKLMFKMFTQFHNFMEVEYLPVVSPPDGKQVNAAQFAAQTSYAMAHALNVLQTSHSYGDVLFLSRASELGKDNCANYMVEMAWVESAFNISTSEAMELLDQFLAMNPDSNGQVGIYGFLSAFGLKLSPLCEKMFRYFDVEKKGSITFRQRTSGSNHYFGEPVKQLLIKSQLGDILLATMSSSTDHPICQLFKKFDVDNDGTISRGDFMTCLKKYPFLLALFAANVKCDHHVELIC
ncbi:Lysophospholipid acyltransferase LPEAT2 [Ananas comosus]|uniref:Lysophospholipid acyltransferase LPEAT2 n=1 Tax=Ananas comosus TaxID=4615 RepID=A0A199VM57_ANACO|nr:Lysophospholipid acyltransferase LPEAT2 [Ananas comosus]